MSLILDIGQGAGLSGSSGVRPYLPPLLAGALARGNVGLDFSGTSYSFLESPWWLALMFALAVASYLLERRRPGAGTSRQVELGLGLLGLAFGALLFAGSLADGNYTSWPGLIGGAALIYFLQNHADTVARWLNHLPALSLDPKQPGIASVVFGGVLIVVMLLVPTGIGGLLRRLLRPLTTRLYTRA